MPSVTFILLSDTQKSVFCSYITLGSAHLLGNYSIILAPYQDMGNFLQLFPRSCSFLRLHQEMVMTCPYLSQIPPEHPEFCIHSSPPQWESLTCNCKPVTPLQGTVQNVSFESHLSTCRAQGWNETNTHKNKHNSQQQNPSNEDKVCQKVPGPERLDH